MQATVGVYITYHNERELLTELISSLVKDENLPDEIVVYDDCSSFPAQDYVPVDAPVRIIRATENRGPAFGRNCLLAQAKSDYVHFHDSDDFFLPGWLRRVREVILGEAPEAIFTEIAPYKGGELQPWRLGLEKLSVERDLLGFCIENAMLVPAGTYRREFVQRIGGYPEDLWQSEDYAFHIRLATRCSKFHIIPEPLVGIRFRSNSRSSNRIEVYSDGLKGLQLLASEIPESHQTHVADAAISKSRWLYQAGERAQAFAGFSWAASLQRASYRNQQWGYRLCARVVGPFYAEVMSSVYRNIPKRIEKLLDNQRAKAHVICCAT